MLVQWPVVHVLLWVEVHYICTFLVGDGIMYILRAVWYISTFKVGTKVTSAGNSAPLTYEWLYLGFMVLTVIYFHMESLTRFLERVRTQLDISVIHSSTSIHEITHVVVPDILPSKLDYSRPSVEGVQVQM